MSSWYCVLVPFLKCFSELDLKSFKRSAASETLLLAETVSVDLWHSHNAAVAVAFLIVSVLNPALI